VPIVSWFALRGECRSCGAAIAARYPLVEMLVGLLFLGVFVTDVVYDPRAAWGGLPLALIVRLVYHLVLVALLVAASFIDVDLMIIPDQVTVPGMIIGVVGGALFPDVRPVPSTALTHWDGLWVGIVGLVVGAGLTQFFRFTFSHVFRREAMGFGDVTLIGMIGAFLGWQAAVLTFFIGPFFGLAHALWKLVAYVGKRLSGRQASSADRELFFGPYLSMAAVALMLSWRWFWPGWAAGLFAALGLVFWLLLGYEV
jgi:leader peptidase (prepilin peptidase)/N-methyltransferase